MGFIYDIIVRLTSGRVLETSDQALDSAADFQRGFETYLPLYNEYTGASLSMEIDIQRPYDELREIDFARLSDVAERAAQVADDVDQQIEDVNTQVATVDSWTGDASNAFRGYIQQFTTATQTIEQELGELATATGEAVPAVQQVIAEYVNAIGDIDFSDFDSPGDISFMIEVERMLKSVGDVIAAVTSWLGNLIGVSLPLPSSGGGGIGGFISDPIGSVTDFAIDKIGDAVGWILEQLGMSVDGFLEWIASKVREYLDSSFRTPFETNLQLLNDAVTAATTGVQEAFQPVIAAATAVTESPYGSLPVPPEHNPNQTSGPPADSGQPGTGSPGTGSPGTGSPGSGSPGASAPPPGPGATPPQTAPAPEFTPPSPTPPSTTPPPVEPPDADFEQPGQPDEDTPDTGRPDDLPPGAGWISDPSQLPQGWTVDPETGELLPPGAPGGEGDPEVHSPEGQDVLDGDENDDTGAPGTGEDVSILPIVDDGLPGDGDGTGGPTSISFQDGDVTITVSGDGGAGDGVSVTLTDENGNTSEYQIRVGEDGRPELVPADEPAGSVGSVGPAGPAVTADLPQPAPLTATPAPADVLGVTEAPAQPAAFAGGGGGGGGFAGGPAGFEPAAAANGAVASGAPTGATPSGDVPTATTAAAVGFGGSTDAGASAGQVSGAPASGGAASGGQVSGGQGVAAGSVTGGGGPGFATSGYAGGMLDGGQVASGNISSGGTTSGDGAAQLASASNSSSAAAGPGGAQLASVGDEARPAQSGGAGTAGAPMMPMGAGAAGGGDEERRSGTWRVPGEDVFDVEHTPGQVRGVIGEDR